MDAENEAQKKAMDEAKSEAGTSKASKVADNIQYPHSKNWKQYKAAHK